MGVQIQAHLERSALRAGTAWQELASCAGSKERERDGGRQKKREKDGGRQKKAFCTPPYTYIARNTGCSNFRIKDYQS